MSLLVPGDLRLRLVAAFVAVLAISQLHTLAVAAGAFATLLAIAILARPGRRLWHRLLHVEGFVILLFLMLPFTVTGTPILVLGPLAASVEGVGRAAIVGAKISASVLAILLFLHAVELERVGGALRGLRVPERLVRLFVLTARYVALFRDEAGRLREAMRARGFAPRTDRHTWRSYGNLVGMLLVRALGRAARVEEAMLCRGYDGRFPYVVLPAPLARDWAGLGLVAAAAIVATGLDRL